MKDFVCALFVGLLCLSVPMATIDTPPKVQVYSRLPAEWEKANTFICHASGFHPPEITIELLRDGEELLGANQSDLAFEENWHYHLTKHVLFSPSEGQVYACRVTHMGRPYTHVLETDV
ncbi:beta-2-microglobulin-like [Brachionichthys hirsutus]|uniref:beta-2-microglobulin-like n=1 Tax=Brachionichthys hirsutus TaxID=412623 RepID=UPI003604EC34